jgi:RND family efflux transporter MFP subunit
MMRRIAKGRILLLTVGGVFGLGIGGWSYLHGRAVDEGEVVRAALSVPHANLLPVSTLTVRLEDAYEVEEGHAGRIVNRRRSDLGFERGGLLVEVAVDEGSRVEQGSVLARLDTRSLEAQRRELTARLAHSRAVYQEMEARLELARTTAKRRGTLLKKEHVSRQAYDEAMLDERALGSQLEASKAAIQEVEANIEKLLVDIEQSAIVAPYDGIIVARLLDEGTAVGVGVPVLSLVEDSVLEARIGVPARAAGDLVPGRTFDISVEGRKHAARLRSVLPKIDPQTRTVPAIFELDDPGRGLRAGQLARLKIKHRVAMRGFWLPVSALIGSRRGLWTAYVVEPTDLGDGVVRISRRELQVLHSEAERVYVRGTLSDGERVVSTGLHRVVPNQLVRVD